MQIIFLKPVLAAFVELPPEDQQEIVAKLDLLQHHPYMYQRWTKSRRFRRHRQFVVGNWRVFYRVVNDTIWIRGIWPASLPLRIAQLKTGKSRS